MKIGFPCLGANLPWRSSKTFRLASYSEARLYETVAHNLEGLHRTLEWSRDHGLMFHRLSSDIVPFGSHDCCVHPWQQEFADKFREVGSIVREAGMRTSMHPDQFTLINSPSEEIFRKTVAELRYHTEVLDLLGLDSTHKIQFHVGGVYGDKDASIRRFIERFNTIDGHIRRRLVIENDDRLFTVDDCLRLHEGTGVPILLDNFHHALNNTGMSLQEAFRLCDQTWGPERDGVLMADYSSQDYGERVGKHAASIELDDFRYFLDLAAGWDFDLMLEIKDKELSALKALDVLRERGLVGEAVGVG